MASNRRRGRRSGLSARDAMHARRAAALEVNPCPPGASSGFYKPLDDAELAAIYKTALRILAELGMGDAPVALKERALSKGATLNEHGRLCFSRNFVEDIIAGACKGFVFYGRDRKHDFEVGGSAVHFGTGGAAEQIMDLDSQHYRPATLQDLYDFARVADTLSNVSWFTRVCVATDISNRFDLDVNTAYALLQGTTKPIGMSFSLDQHVDAIVDMFDMALGGEGAFAKRPFCKAHISPVISPLCFNHDAVAVTLACIKRNVPINNIIAAQSGATSPATLAGTLAQTLAETLASLILINVFTPGHPMVFSNWPLVADLRTGSFAGSGGEITLLNAAAAQLANWLGLPSGVAASMADAKAMDAQMGMEKALSALATGISGANMIYESLGMTASLSGASLEAFVIDDEMLSHVYRVLRGIEVNEETLGFDVIRDTVGENGNFLGATHTLIAMQRDHFYPTLADRLPIRSWNELGARDISYRARLRVREILDTHKPHYIDADADKHIRDRFAILL